MKKKAARRPVAQRRAGPFAVTVWFCYALTAAMLALCLSWGAYAQFDYGYPVWYRVLHIDQHIDRYAPQNRYHRHDLERLSASQHEALFHRIVVAVHHQGKGLDQITYPDRYGTPVPLLRAPEIQHLRDVSHFIDKGRWLALILALLWLPLARAVRNGPRVGGRQRLLVVGVPLLALLAWLLIAGPEAVFYRFHIWLFPAGHEWFFYWQDSLMSTLMKAPDLFGAIALVLVACTALITPLLYWGGLGLVARLFAHRRRAHSSKT